MSQKSEKLKTITGNITHKYDYNAHSNSLVSECIIMFYSSTTSAGAKHVRIIYSIQIIELRVEDVSQC